MSYSILLVVIGGVIVALATFFDRQPMDRWKAKILSGSVLVVIGGGWGAYDQQKADQTIAEKNEKIAQLSLQVLATVTGGDSFCYIAPETGQSNEPLVLLLHKGEYPLYDLWARVVDVQKFDAIEHHRWEDFAKSETNVNLGTLIADTARPLGRLFTFPSEVDRQDYNIFFSARNGLFTENLRLRRVNGEWTSAIRVFRDEGKKQVELLTRVAADYPRNEQGEVEW